MAVVDSQAQRKFNPIAPNAREGYVNIEGKWRCHRRSAGHALNRGSYEADILYLHGYGVGFPADLLSNNLVPTYGQVGFGVLPNGYSAGLVYSTPSLAGHRIERRNFPSDGLFRGFFEGDATKAPRPEFELTVDEQLGSAGKMHLYVNGTTQTNYRPALRPTIFGNGVGPRLRRASGARSGPPGGGGFRGTGVGFTYFGQSDSSVMNDNSQMRDANGYYAIRAALARQDGRLQRRLGHLGAKVLDVDRESNPDPSTSINPATSLPIRL